MFPSVHIGYITGNAEDWLSSVAWLFYPETPMIYPARTLCFCVRDPHVIPRRAPSLLPQEPRVRLYSKRSEHQASSSLDEKCVWRTRKASSSVAVEKSIGFLSLEIFWLIYSSWMILFCFLCLETRHSKQRCVDQLTDKFWQARTMHGTHQKAKKYGK